MSKVRFYQERRGEVIDKSIECNFEDFDSDEFADWLISKARSIFRLMSSDVDALKERENNKKGIIVVGGFREVGKWEAQ